MKERVFFSAWGSFHRYHSFRCPFFFSVFFLSSPLLLTGFVWAGFPPDRAHIVLNRFQRFGEFRTVTPSHPRCYLFSLVLPLHTLLSLRVFRGNSTSFVSLVGVCMYVWCVCVCVCVVTCVRYYSDVFVC